MMQAWCSIKLYYRYKMKLSCILEIKAYIYIYIMMRGTHMTRHTDNCVTPASYVQLYGAKRSSTGEST